MTSAASFSKRGDTPSSPLALLVFICRRAFNVNYSSIISNLKSGSEHEFTTWVHLLSLLPRSRDCLRRVTADAKKRIKELVKSIGNLFVVSTKLSVYLNILNGAWFLFPREHLLHCSPESFRIVLMVFNQFSLVVSLLCFPYCIGYTISRSLIG